MTCSHGGITITRHNDIRDITANWLSEVCRNVERYLEPLLLPLMGENIIPLSANRREDARADIHATGFCGCQQCAFFDVTVFHPNTKSYRHSSTSSLYQHHEQAKKRDYGDRSREVENGTFTPLVFATTGGMSREATLLYKRLADEKNNTLYSKTMAWIRCTLSFSLLRSAVMCSRSITH